MTVGWGGKKKKKITCVLCSWDCGVVLEAWGCLPNWWIPFVPLSKLRTIQRRGDYGRVREHFDYSVVPWLPKEVSERNKVFYE